MALLAIFERTVGLVLKRNRLHDDHDGGAANSFKSAHRRRFESGSKNQVVVGAKS